MRYRTADGRKSEWLCDKDEAHFSTDAPAVKELADAAMVEVRKKRPTNGSDGVVAYWEDVYLPTVTKHLKPSTVEGYRQIWHQWLAPEFAGRTFSDYKVIDGNKLLNKLIDEKYSKNTIQHVRALARGIFSHACTDGLIDPPINVWTSVKTKIKPPKTKKQPVYTLTELMDIVNNKLTRIDAQLIVCLAGLMGLRPSEIVGLSWEDVNLQSCRLRVHQANVRGNIGTTKTDEDVTLPMLQLVRGLFKAWHAQCGEPVTGWVFKGSRNGDPLNIRDYVLDVLRPSIPGWKSLYAFRRGAGSIVTDLTGNPVAAQHLLRHLDLSTSMRHYIQTNKAALEEAVRMLDERLGLPSGNSEDRC